MKSKTKLQHVVFLRRVEVTIQHHFQNPEFDVNRLCTELNVSRAQLHRKLCLAESPPALSLIHSQRLALACNHLRNTCLTVSEIAYCCGFNHPPYFTRLFYREKRLTPTQFRKAEWDDFVEKE